MQKNEISKPITTPGGFLILKIRDIIYENVNIDIDKELENLIQIETNRQLDQFSNIYFSKIKKSTLISDEL